MRQAWEHQWSSARHHVAGEADPLLDEPGWLAAELRRQDYRSYLRNEPEEAVTGIRRMTATSRPLGGTAFLSTLESRLDRVLGPQKSGRPREGSRGLGECLSGGPTPSRPDAHRSLFHLGTGNSRACAALTFGARSHILDADETLHCSCAGR